MSTLKSPIMNLVGATLGLIGSLLLVLLPLALEAALRTAFAKVTFMLLHSVMPAVPEIGWYTSLVLVGAVYAARTAFGVGQRVKVGK